MKIARTLTFIYIAVCGAFVASGVPEARLNQAMTDEILANHQLAVGDPQTVESLAFEGREGRLIMKIINSGARLAIGQGDFSDFIVNFNQRADLLEFTGIVRLGDESLYRIHLETADGEARDYYLDQDTFLVRAVSVHPAGSQQGKLTVFKDYHRVGEIMVPTSRILQPDAQRDDAAQSLREQCPDLASANPADHQRLGGVTWGANLLPGTYSR